MECVCELKDGATISNPCTFHRVWLEKILQNRKQSSYTISEIDTIRWLLTERRTPRPTSGVYCIDYEEISRKVEEEIRTYMLYGISLEDVQKGLTPG